MEKIKIRRVEVNIEEFKDRIAKLILISEKVDVDIYGIPIKKLCQTLGLKELEFWEIYFNNQELFDDGFTILQHPNLPSLKKIVLDSTWELRDNKIIY